MFRTCSLMCIFIHFIHRSFQANSHLQNDSPHSSVSSQRVTLHQTSAEPETNLHDLGTFSSLHLGKKRRSKKQAKKKKCKCQQTKKRFFLASPPSQKGELSLHEWRSAQPQVEAMTSHLAPRHSVWIKYCAFNSCKQKDGAILLTYADDSIVYT